MIPNSVMLAITLEGKDPPTEFRLFHAGVNKSRKGPFVFDEDAAAKVMAAYAEHGIERLNFDYEHAQLIPGTPVEDKKSAGTFVPEVRLGPELWVTKAEWTKRAHNGISDREWLYFSPAIDFDKDRRITRLINCALTNLPALDGIPMLTATSHLSAALQESFDDISKKLYEAVEKRLGGRPVWIAAIYDDHFIYEVEGASYSQTYTLVDGIVALGSDPIEVKKEYVPVTAAATMAEAPGATSMSAETRETPVSNREEGRPMAAVLSMIAILGLAESATETDVLTEIGRLQSSQREILSLTGKATIEEAKGTIQAWKASAEEYAKASVELSEIKARAKADARAALLSQHSRKFTPNELEGWVKEASYEFLSSYVQSAPDRVPAESAAPVEPAVDRVVLSADEHAIAKQLGLTDKQFAESRANLEKGGAQ